MTFEQTSLRTGLGGVACGRTEDTDKDGRQKDAANREPDQLRGSGTTPARGKEHLGIGLRGGTRYVGRGMRDFGVDPRGG